MDQFDIVITLDHRLPSIIRRFKPSSYSVNDTEPPGWISSLSQRQWEWRSLCEGQFLGAPADRIEVKVQLLDRERERVRTLHPVEVNACSIDGVVHYVFNVRFFRPGDDAAKRRHTVTPPHTDEAGIDVWNPGLSINIWPTVHQGLIIYPDGSGHSATVDRGGCAVALVAETEDNDWTHFDDYHLNPLMELAGREIAESLRKAEA